MNDYFSTDCTGEQFPYTKREAKSKVVRYMKIGDDSLYKSNSEMLAKVINEVLDCYFLHRNEGLLEAARRLEQVSKELGIIE